MLSSAFDGGGGATGLSISAGADVTVDGDSFTGLATGISLMDPSTVVSNCHFDGITADTISVSMGTTPFDPANLDHGNTATNSAVNGVWLKDPVFADGASLFGRDGWGLVISNYSYGPQTVNVPAGATLSVPAGAVVKFRYRDMWPNGAYVGSLNVAGTLIAHGSTSYPVILTSDKDDTAGGDTNNDGDASAPTSAYWSGVVVGIGDAGSPSARLDGTQIRYAYTCLSVNAGSSTRINGNLSLCATGVTSSTNYVDARNVYWGDSTGPAPYGNGPAIYGDVQVYPWVGIEAVEAPAQPLPTSGSTCKPVLFLGVRGSGEAPEWGDALDWTKYTWDEDWDVGQEFTGMGNKVQAILDGSSPEGNYPAGDSFMQSLAEGGIPRSQVEVRAFVYEAASTDLLTPSYQLATDLPVFDFNGVKSYMASIDNGKRGLVGLLALLHEHCPDQRIALAGYSQGSLVIHEALNELVDEGKGVVNNVDAVMLLADPGQRAFSTRPKLGSSAPGAKGVWQYLVGTDKRDISSEVKGVVAYCNDLDVVCALEAASTTTLAGDPDSWGVIVHSSYNALELRQLGRLGAYDVLDGLGR